MIFGAYCRHRTAQGHVVSGRDCRAPYPSMHERHEFNEEASNFTRMDINSKDALSTLANLAQARCPVLVIILHLEQNRRLFKRIGIFFWGIFFHRVK